MKMDAITTAVDPVVHAHTREASMSTRKRCIEDICIGYCAECAEDVVANFFNDGTVKVKCTHSSICSKRHREGAIDIATGFDFADSDLLWLRAAWPEVDWTQEGRHSFGLEGAFEIVKAPPPSFGKRW
jgi:hypothetical protein